MLLLVSDLDKLFFLELYFLFVFFFTAVVPEGLGDGLDELDEIIKNNDENFDNLSDEDEALITKSIDLIKSTNKASTSFLQRNFQVGYNKAARIMEALEQRGVVSPPNHAGKRDILINQSTYFLII